MTLVFKRPAASQPGQMESHPTHRKHAHPRCPLQELYPKDPRTMCHTLDQDDDRLSVCAGEEGFQLHLRYLGAHGISKGEVTVLSTAGAAQSNRGRDPAVPSS